MLRDVRTGAEEVWQFILGLLVYVNSAQLLIYSIGFVVVLAASAIVVFIVQMGIQKTSVQRFAVKTMAPTMLVLLALAAFLLANFAVRVALVHSGCELSSRLITLDNPLGDHNLTNSSQEKALYDVYTHCTSFRGNGVQFEYLEQKPLLANATSLLNAVNQLNYVNRDLRFLYDNLPALTKILQQYEARERFEFLDQLSLQKALDQFNELIACSGDVYVLVMPPTLSGSKRYVIVDSEASYNPPACVAEKEKARKAFENIAQGVRETRELLKQMITALTEGEASPKSVERKFIGQLQELEEDYIRTVIKLPNFLRLSATSMENRNCQLMQTVFFNFQYRTCSLLSQHVLFFLLYSIGFVAVMTVFTWIASMGVRNIPEFRPRVRTDMSMEQKSAESEKVRI